MRTFTLIPMITAALLSAVPAQEPFRRAQEPPVPQAKKSPASPAKPPAYVRSETVASISEVTDVRETDGYYQDLKSLIERYGISGLTKDKKFNGAANLSYDDLGDWTASGQTTLMSLAARQGIDFKKYSLLLGKGCGAPRVEAYTEAQAMKVIQCRFIVPALKTSSPEKIVTRGRFVSMLNQALNLWLSGLAKAISDMDAANAARIAARMSFFDTFDNSAKGWMIGENSAAKSSIADSRFLLNMKFDAILISTIPVAKAPKLDPNRDFSIEVSFAFTSGAPTSSFGLVWGVSGDQKRRHSCGILQGGSYYFGKHAGGKWKDEIKLGETNLIKKGPDAMNNLIVRKRGNLLDLNLNTIRVATVPYVAFDPGGTFGFQLFGESSVSVDYIRVQQD